MASEPLPSEALDGADQDLLAAIDNGASCRTTLERMREHAQACVALHRRAEAQLERERDEARAVEQNARTGFERTIAKLRDERDEAALEGARLRERVKRQNLLLGRAVQLLIGGRDQRPMTAVVRAAWQDGVDELVAEIRGGGDRG